MLVACAGVIGDTDGFLPPDIDYLRLFEIAKNLISTDKGKNTTGLNDLDEVTGLPIGDQIVTWYEAIKLTWNAAKSITHNIRSRDLQVNACVSLYFAQEIYE
jgi:hypothetical protein